MDSSLASPGRDGNSMSGIAVNGLFDTVVRQADPDYGVRALWLEGGLVVVMRVL